MAPGSNWQKVGQMKRRYQKGPAGDFFRTVNAMLDEMQRLAGRLGEKCPTCGRPFQPDRPARPPAGGRSEFPGGRLSVDDKRLLDEMVCAGFKVLAKQYHPDVSGQNDDRTLQRLKALRDALVRPPAAS